MNTITTRNLFEMTPDELKAFAKANEITLPPSAGKDTAREAIAVEMAKREEIVKRKVAAALEADAVERLGLTGKGATKPFPEDVAILASKKWYVEFLNMEQPAADGEMGAPLECTKGTYSFYLQDGRVHVLPGVLVCEKVEQVLEVRKRLEEFWAANGLPVSSNGKKPSQRKMAEMVIRRLSIPMTCTYPIYADGPDPTGRFEKISVKVGEQPRFKFNILGEAPVNAKLGLVTDAKELRNAKRSQLAPLG